MISGRCQTCMWFQKADKAPDEGECHRNPPVAAVSEKKQGNATRVTVVTSWPGVKYDEWCGEYRPETSKKFG